MCTDWKTSTLEILPGRLPDVNTSDLYRDLEKWDTSKIASIEYKKGYFIFLNKEPINWLELLFDHMRSRHKRRTR